MEQLSLWQLCWDRLPLVVTFFVNLWRDRPQIRYDYALLLALKDQGEVARTSRIMQTLAPLKKTNGQSSYAPAQPRPTASQAGR